MTLEEYEQKYPEACHGCITISTIYDYFTDKYGIMENDKMCGVILHDNPDTCPCKNCLIKVCCVDACDKIMKIEDKIEDKISKMELRNEI